MEELKTYEINETELAKCAYAVLSTALEENSLVIKKGALEFLPNSTISLNDEQMSELEKLLDKLEDDDDVQAVYTNVE